MQSHAHVPRGTPGCCRPLRSCMSFRRLHWRSQALHCVCVTYTYSVCSSRTHIHLLSMLFTNSHTPTQYALHELIDSSAHACINLTQTAPWRRMGFAWVSAAIALQHTTTPCSTLRRNATPCYTLQNTSEARCHSNTHCNTVVRRS